MDLLFLAHRAPFPPDRGDRIRSYHILRHLAVRARVHLVAFVDRAEEVEPAPELVALTASRTLIHRRKSRPRALAEAIASGRALSMAAFADPRFGRAVRAVTAAHPIAATYAFSGQMAQHIPADTRAIMDLVDVDSAKFAAMAAGSRLAPLYRREARLLAAEERAVAARAHATLLVSEAEAALLRAGGATGQIEVVENGIDAGVFDPTGFPLSTEPLIVFTGQMDYAPNVEAARWLVERVLPILPPPARVAIVGRAPTPAVRALAGGRVTVTGEVADVRPWLARAAVAVAPLHLARGIQNKVLEAMAMARAVVATPAAAEGIDHAGTIRIAADPLAFAAEVAVLLADGDAAAALGRAARARVLARYNWTARLASIDRLLP